MKLEDVKDFLFSLVIDNLGKLLAEKVDSQIWPDAKYFVEEHSRIDLTNAEKHEKVKSRLSSLFGEELSGYSDIASTLLDTFIKLAYLYFKLK